jgi:hypothetical protein
MCYSSHPTKLQTGAMPSPKGFMGYSKAIIQSQLLMHSQKVKNGLILVS